MTTQRVTQHSQFQKNKLHSNVFLIVASLCAAALVVSGNLEGTTPMTFISSLILSYFFVKSQKN